LRLLSTSIPPFLPYDTIIPHERDFVTYEIPEKGKNMKKKSPHGPRTLAKSRKM